MARSVTRRSRVLAASTCPPEAPETLETYTAQQGISVTRLPAKRGRIEPGAVRPAVDDSIMAVVIQFPNFLGLLEEVEEIIQVAHAAGALRRRRTFSSLATKRSGGSMRKAVCE